MAKRLRTAVRHIRDTGSKRPDTKWLQDLLPNDGDGESEQEEKEEDKEEGTDPPAMKKPAASNKVDEEDDDEEEYDAVKRRPAGMRRPAAAQEDGEDESDDDKPMMRKPSAAHQDGEDGEDESDDDKPMMKRPSAAVQPSAEPAAEPPPKKQKQDAAPAVKPSAEAAASAVKQSAEAASAIAEQAAPPVKPSVAVKPREDMTEEEAFAADWEGKVAGWQIQSGEEGLSMFESVAKRAKEISSASSSSSAPWHRGVGFAAMAREDPQPSPSPSPEPEAPKDDELHRVTFDPKRKKAAPRRKQGRKWGPPEYTSDLLPESDSGVVMAHFPTGESFPVPGITKDDLLELMKANLEEKESGGKAKGITFWAGTRDDVALRVVPKKDSRRARPLPLAILTPPSLLLHLLLPLLVLLPIPLLLLLLLILPLLFLVILLPGTLRPLPAHHIPPPPHHHILPLLPSLALRSAQMMIRQARMTTTPTHCRHTLAWRGGG